MTIVQTRVALLSSARSVLSLGRIVAGFGLPIGALLVLDRFDSFHRPDAGLGGASVLETYLPVLIMFAIGLFTLTALPAALAGHREAGAPGGWAGVLIGRTAGAAVLSLAATAALIVVGAYQGVVPPRQLAGFLAVLALTLVLSLAGGALIGRLTPTARFAQYVGTPLLIALLWFAGLFGPIRAMHGALHVIAEATPLGSAALAMQDTWQGHAPALLPLLILAGWTVVAVLAAIQVYRRR